MTAATIESHPPSAANHDMIISDSREKNPDGWESLPAANTPATTSFILRTGNVLRNYTPNFADELKLGLETALLNANTSKNNCPKYGFDRKELSINVEIFLRGKNATPANIKECIYAVLEELDVTQVDSVILCTCNILQQMQQESQSYDQQQQQQQRRLIADAFRPFWEAMEEAVAAGLTRKIGVCNFTTKDQLEELLSFAKVRPYANQISFAHKNNNNNNRVYHVDQDLMDTCKREGIKVLAGSSDELLVAVESSATKSVIQSHHLQRGIAGVGGGGGVANSSSSSSSTWTARYLVTRKRTSQIIDLGYVVQCSSTTTPTATGSTATGL